MPNMDEIAGRVEKILMAFGMRNTLVVFCILLLVVLYFLSRVTGWHELAKYYPARNPYQGKWIGHDLDEVEVRFSSSTGVNSIRLGADAQGLYISMWIGYRPFHPPLFIPWSDVTAVRIKEVPWIRKPNLVKYIFAMDPDVPVYVGKDIAEEIENHSEGQWKMPELN